MTRNFSLRIVLSVYTNSNVLFSFHLILRIFKFPPDFFNNLSTLKYIFRSLCIHTTFAVYLVANFWFHFIMLW